MDAQPRPDADGFELTAADAHVVLNFMLCYWLPRLMEHAAPELQLRIVWEFIGAGGGTWTMIVAAGEISVSEDRSDKADLVLTQTAETFFNTLRLWHDPMVALLKGEIKVQGFEHMSTLSELLSDRANKPIE